MKGSSLAHLFIYSAKQCIFSRDSENTFTDFPSVSPPLELRTLSWGAMVSPGQQVWSVWGWHLLAAQRLVCTVTSSPGCATLVQTQLRTLVSNHWIPSTEMRLLLRWLAQVLQQVDLTLNLTLSPPVRSVLHPPSVMEHDRGCCTALIMGPKKNLFREIPPFPSEKELTNYP